MGFVRDVTEKLLPKQLSIQEAKLQAFLDTTLDGVFRMTASGRMVSFNLTVTDCVGREEKDVRDSIIPLIDDYQSKELVILGIENS